jgi:hypothetical protein
VTSYYVVEEEDSFHADDFGNDDAPARAAALAGGAEVDFDEYPDEFFADDFGNDSRIVPSAPTSLTVTVH